MQERINKNTIICIIATIATLIIYCCLEPMLSQMYGFYAFSIFAVPYKILKQVLPAVVIILFVYEMVRKKGNVCYGALLPIVIMFICYLIPTAISGENVDVWAESVFPLLAYYMFAIALCYKKEYMKLFIRFISDFYLLIAIINLVFTINPSLFSLISSWTPEAFITTIENQTGFPLVMGLFFCLLDKHLNGRKVVFYVYLPVYLLSIFMAWTVAQVMGALVVILYLIPPVRKIFEKTNIVAWFAISIVIFIVCVFCWEPIKNTSVIKFLMVDVLKKDVTFSGRLHIWNGVWQMIQEKPILGHGLMENPQMLFFDVEFNYNYVHAHNTFLQTWYEGGILTLIAVGAVFAFSSWKSKTIKDRKLLGIINLIIFVYLINFEMDGFFMYPWRTCMWCMLCFLCNFAVVVTEHDY